MRQSNRWLVLGLIVAGVQLSACGGTPAKAAKNPPSKVEPIVGTKLSRVTLTPRAAERLGIKTAPVREMQIAGKRVIRDEVAASPITKVADPPDPLVRVLPLASHDAAPAGLTGQPLAVSAARNTTGATATLEAVDRPEPGVVPDRGVRVEPSAPVNGTRRKVISYAAVLYDVNGGTWAYTNPEPHVFVRQRLIVDHVDGEVAVLSDGPPVGAAVVTVGASLLFGIELGFGK